MCEQSFVFLLVAVVHHVCPLYVCDPGMPSRAEILVLAEKGRMAIEYRDLESARAYLAAAIRLNPLDSGNGVLDESWHTGHLAEDGYGKRELEKLLRDRPEMAEFRNLKSFVPLYEWTAKRLAGQDIGKVIKWNAGEVTPQRGQAKTSSFTTYYGRHEAIGEIRIRPSAGTVASSRRGGTCDRMWADLAFELGNAAVAAEIARVSSRISRGELNRNEGVVTMFTLHLRAAELARGFFVAYYLPFAIDAGIEVDVHRWPLSERTWGNAQSILTLPAAESNWAWEFYGEYYDRVRASHRSGSENQAHRGR